MSETVTEKVGYLHGKSVYLCGPISFVDDDGVKWREHISPKLEAFGIKIEDPTKKTVFGVGEIKDDKDYFKKLIKERKFKECKEKFWPIVRKDLRSVDLADFLIVNFLPKIPTVGTIHEIIVASHMEKKPVLLHVSEKELDNLNPWILTFVKPQWIFTNWIDMINYLTSLDKTGPKMDSSHWTL